MRTASVCFLPVFLMLGAPILGESGGGRQAEVHIENSKADAWSETVTDFVTDRHLLSAFKPEDVAEHFKALLPPESLKVNTPWVGEVTGGAQNVNGARGIAGLDFELSDLANNMYEISWVNILMPRTDADGVDVMSRVVAAMKRKLRQPWRLVPNSNRRNGYYWEQRKALLAIRVQTDESVPHRDGTPNEGPWVVVHFGRVEGFGQP